jgi:hypothetical protein
MTFAIAITMMLAGIVFVTLECAVTGSVLLGGAALIVRYAFERVGHLWRKWVPSRTGPYFARFPKAQFKFFGF